MKDLPTLRNHNVDDCIYFVTDANGNVMSFALEGGALTGGSGVGGILIFAIGLNLLKITRLPLANLLPALPVAVGLALLL